MPSERNSLVALLAALMIALLTSLSLPAQAQQFSEKAIESKPAKELFGRVKDAAKLEPRAIGFYAKGCLSGGVQLPATGSAWQAMRLSRNRNWGHPELVELVKRLAIEARAQDGWNGLLVGDLAQPRGGPMLTGHASHQIGLDADIWLKPMPDRELTFKEREKISAVSVIKSRHSVNRKIWTEAHARLIRRAASYPQVARIFVHPPIKKELCDWSANQSDRSWLKKVRPYYGHHYHFHIRIKCPKGFSGCRNQNPAAPKDGTGCGDELAYWLGEKPWAQPKKDKDKDKKKKKVKPRPRPQLKVAGLPKACKAVLTAD
jgi:penicillin-insensitive murein endopeptidase